MQTRDGVVLVPGVKVAKYAAKINLLEEAQGVSISGMKQELSTKPRRS